MLSLVHRRHGSSWGPNAFQPEARLLHEAHNRVGPYRLCFELASGGMASVYLARCDSEHGSGRLVAVKLIHPHLANDREFIEMFMDEAELASQIRHPNVCAVLDYALRQDESYLVMEHLTGESLMSVGRRIERSKDLDPQRLARCVARVLADACEGLHAAHELTDVDGEPLHVVHRDVSPENVFVTYDGIAKVMDFGVAAAAHKRHRTLTGVVKGKFASVAPECLKGRKPDRRADVWGIGVIAWELLTGQRLFRRDTDVDTLGAVVDLPIQRPSELRSGVPSTLDDIVMHALERDPEQRYATARELSRDLARFCVGGGEVVTCADVADWMREMFPGGRQRRQQILELAAQLGPATDEGTPSHVGSRAPTRSTLLPAPPSAEPNLETSVWQDPRSTSQEDPRSTPSHPPPLPQAPPPQAPPPLPISPPSEPRPPSGLHWQSMWRTGWVVFMIASAGAVTALLAQAFFNGPAFRMPRSIAQPLLAPAPGASPSAAASDRPREIVLRIRIGTAGDAPAVVVEPDAAQR